MKDNDFIKRVTGALLRKKNKRAFDRSMMHPEREWFVAIFVVCLIIVASAVWNFIQYKEFSLVSVESADGGAGSSVYSGGVVFTALTELEEREKEYNELKNSIMGKTAPVIVPQAEVPDVEVVPETEVKEDEAPTTEPSAAVEAETVVEEGVVELAI